MVERYRHGKLSGKVWRAVCVKNSLSRRRLLQVATTFFTSTFTFRVDILTMHADVRRSRRRSCDVTLEVTSTSFYYVEVASLVFGRSRVASFSTSTFGSHVASFSMSTFGSHAASFSMSTFGSHVASFSMSTFGSHVASFSMSTFRARARTDRMTERVL